MEEQGKRKYGLLYILKEITNIGERNIYRYRILYTSEKDIESDIINIKHHGGSWSYKILFITHTENYDVIHKLEKFIEDINTISPPIMVKEGWIELNTINSERFDIYLLCLYKNILRQKSVSMIGLEGIIKELIRTKNDINDIDEYLYRILCYIESMFRRKR